MYLLKIILSRSASKVHISNKFAFHHLLMYIAVSFPNLKEFSSFFICLILSITQRSPPFYTLWIRKAKRLKLPSNCCPQDLIKKTKWQNKLTHHCSNGFVIKLGLHFSPMSCTSLYITYSGLHIDVERMLFCCLWKTVSRLALHIVVEKFWTQSQDEILC